MTDVSLLHRNSLIQDRFENSDWGTIQSDMNRQGWTVLSGLLSLEETVSLAHLWNEAQFRSRIIMERYAFGRGEYRYFSYPLPSPVQALRSALYPYLVTIANRWNNMLGLRHVYPVEHAHFLENCHTAGQQRPTPLMLNYGPGDYCCLHQDLYGPLNFPIQAVIMLDDMFTGGEFILTHHGRNEARTDVIPLQRGDIVLFAVNERPERGQRGFVRTKMRHGVSEIRSGHRRTLGLIFHDAR